MSEMVFTEQEFAAFIGIDWADQKHAWALRDASSVTVMEKGELTHTPEAVDAWAAQLSQRFGGRPIAVALEQSRGSLLFMLSKYAHLVLFPIHPATSAHYRKGFRPSGAKSDLSDAVVILDLLVHHRDKLRRLDPDTVETRLLRFLVEERRKLVADRTRYSNRLTAVLKTYFPQVLSWFFDVSSEVAGDFLERWPMLEKVQRARPETLRKFFVGHGSARKEGVEARIEEIRRAVAAVKDEAVLQSCASATAALIPILRSVRNAISSYDEQIERLARQHPDFAICDSFPGAGAVLAPRLIAALGTQRDRYATARELLCYSGIAPVLESSGKQHWVHWRWACPKFVRQPFTNGRGAQSACQRGPRNFTRSNVLEANRITASSARSLTNGYGFCSAAGRTAKRITRTYTTSQEPCGSRGPPSQLRYSRIKFVKPLLSQRLPLQQVDLYKCSGKAALAL